MIRWLLKLWHPRDEHDPAWRATGYTRTTDAHYDEARASAGYRRSRQQTATGRRYARKPERHDVIRFPDRDRKEA